MKARNETAISIITSSDERKRFAELLPLVPSGLTEDLESHTLKVCHFFLWPCQ